MPRAKRYFPVSHDINEDPELWNLTDTCGDRSIRVWLEILRILDKNENTFRMCPQTAANLSRKCRQSLATVWRVVGHALANGWLEVGQTLANDSATIYRAPKYLKYHKTQEHKGDKDVSPPNLTIPNLTIPNHKERREVARAHHWPKDFILTAKRRDYAIVKGFTNVESLWEHFKNHHEAKGSLFKNWDAAWRTWILNQVTFTKPIRSHGGPRSLGVPKGNAKEIMAG